MSAALAFEPTTLISPDSSTIEFAANILMDKLANDDLFEEGEMMPSAPVILNAASSVPFDYLDNAEVSPFFGELNLTWRHEGKRVKAIFGPAAERFAVYWEEMDMQHGTVVQHKITPEADYNSLIELLLWVTS